MSTLPIRRNVLVIDLTVHQGNVMTYAEGIENAWVQKVRKKRFVCGWSKPNAAYNFDSTMYIYNLISMEPKRGCVAILRATYPFFCFLFAVVQNACFSMRFVFLELLCSPDFTFTLPKASKILWRMALIEIWYGVLGRGEKPNQVRWSKQSYVFFVLSIFIFSPSWTSNTPCDERLKGSVWCLAWWSSMLSFLTPFYGRDLASMISYRFCQLLHVLLLHIGWSALACFKYSSTDMDTHLIFSSLSVYHPINILFYLDYSCSINH